MIDAADLLLDLALVVGLSFAVLLVVGLCATLSLDGEDGEP